MPQILSREEVARLIDAARTLRGRTLLMTTYAAGLRVSEVCNLQVRDIESAADRMCLKVVARQGRQGSLYAAVAAAARSAADVLARHPAAAVVVQQPQRQRPDG
ncbi:MAG TPA: integrase, partial [Candidatus Accumulibacter sp.]|nr:integrase [Accumulibacter sp.]